MKASGRPTRNRRGVSTIIGATFFLILMIAALGTVLYSISQLDSYTRTIQEMNQLDTDRLRESVVITSAYLDRYQHLIINITNTGQTTAHIIKYWLINQSDNGQKNYNISLFITPGNTASYNSSADGNAKITREKSYSIRIITEKGSIASFFIAPKIKARILILAETGVPLNSNMTAMLMITNNDTSNTNLYDVTPTLTVTPVSGAILKEGPIPTSIPLLRPGETAFFRYTYTLTSPSATFNGSFVGAPSGVFSIGESTAAVTATSETSALPIITVSLMSNFPDPVGTRYNRNYFALTVANPYNRPMRIFSIQFYALGTQIFSTTFTNNYPPNPAEWRAFSVGSASGVIWERATGYYLGPRDMVNFTFTSQGQNVYTMAGFAMEMTTTAGRLSRIFSVRTQDTAPSPAPAISVFYSKSNATPTTTYTYVLTVPEKTLRQFNVTFYNGGGGSLSGTYNLSITVPAGWTNVSAPLQAGWLTPSVTTNLDQSTTITVQSSDLAANTANTFSFYAKSPGVTVTTLYAFVTLGTTAVFPSSVSISEAVVKVTP